MRVTSTESEINKGVELKIARIKAGLKQYELAAILKIGATKLSEMESGRRAIPPEVLEKIRQILNETQKAKGTT